MKEFSMKKSFVVIGNCVWRSLIIDWELIEVILYGGD